MQARADAVPPRRGHARAWAWSIAAAALGIAAVAGTIVTTASSPLWTGQPPTTIPAHGSPSPANTATLETSLAVAHRAASGGVDFCGAPVATIAPSGTGLVLRMQFPVANAGTAAVEGTVTVTNTSHSVARGDSAAGPEITLSRNGVVLWHTNGPTFQVARRVDLAPGDSMTYKARFTPVVCGVDDDRARQFPDDLPAMSAGEYQATAILAFHDEARSPAADLITGPSQTITLR